MLARRAYIGISKQYYLRLFERKCVVVVLTICQGIGHNLANRWLPGMQEIADTAQFAFRLAGSLVGCVCGIGIAI